MLIPDNRPVLGRDLESVRQAFGLLTSEACYLFGISISKWTIIVRKNPEKQIDDASLALLVRFLDEHPELSVVPKFPLPHEFFHKLNSITPIDQKRFAILFGAESSAGYRWLRNPSSRHSPFVIRLMYYMQQSLAGKDVVESEKVLNKWVDVVTEEGRNRGVSDVLRDGTWNQERASRRPLRPHRAISPLAPKGTVKPLPPKRKPKSR